MCGSAASLPHKTILLDDAHVLVLAVDPLWRLRARRLENVVRRHLVRVDFR